MDASESRRFDQGGGRDVLDDDLALALHGTHDHALVETAAMLPGAVREAALAGEVGLVHLDIAREDDGEVVLRHERVADHVEHPPCGLVGDTKLAFELLRGDTASGACDEEQRVVPEMEGRGRLVEDRPRRGMDMASAMGAGPRLATVPVGVLVENPLHPALGHRACSPSGE